AIDVDRGIDLRHHGIGLGRKSPAPHLVAHAGSDVRRIRGRKSKVQKSKVQKSKVQKSKVQNSKVQNSKVQNSKVQKSKVQTSTVCSIMTSTDQRPDTEAAAPRRRRYARPALMAALAAAAVPSFAAVYGSAGL